MQKSNHFFGKEVKLDGLKNQHMNGMLGLCKGFLAEAGRRAVYVYERKSLIAIKPENLKLSSPKGECDRPKLCDIQDRLGSVCLLELTMGNRVDVANHLLTRHNPRVDIADWDGCSPKSMSLSNGAGLMSAVCLIVQKYSLKQDRAEAKAVENRCGNCKKESSDWKVCARCKQVQYCSKTCQVQHWNNGGHKAVCKHANVETITLETPQSENNGMHSSTTFNFRQRKSSGPDGGYSKPSTVAVDEKFYIKIQGSASTSVPLFIYDKTRECSFQLESGERGFQELHCKVCQEKSTMGRKTYMKASFDEAGNMTVYLNESKVKTTW